MKTVAYRTTEEELLQNFIDHCEMLNELDNAYYEYDKIKLQWYLDMKHEGHQFTLQDFYEHYANYMAQQGITVPRNYLQCN